MAKPTQTTEWCSDASYVEPSAGKKLVGFDPGERPPAQYLDWLLFTIELWLAWLDTIVAPGSGAEALSISSAGVLTADGKHGDRKLIISPLTFNFDDAGTGTPTKTRIQLSTGTIPSGNGFIAAAPIPTRVGDRIRSLLIYVGGISNDWDLQLTRVARATGTESVIATANFTANGERELTAIDHTVLEDSTYYVVLRRTADALNADITASYIEVTYDRPV